MSLMRPGSFSGIWHGDPVKCSVLQVLSNGAFNGVATFTGGRHQGIQFVFTGVASNSGGLTVNREVEGGTQTASAGMFDVINNECVWKGTTTGPGIPAPGLPFEFRVPSLVKTGTFQGLWHGDNVSFKFVQVFGAGQFTGVGMFVSGRFNGIQFGFTGDMTGLGGVRIDRAVDAGTQTTFDPTPQLTGNNCVWQGVTTGEGIPAPGLPFQLTVPL